MINKKSQKDLELCFYQFVFSVIMIARLQDKYQGKSGNKSDG